MIQLQLPPRNRLILYGVVAAIGLSYLTWVKLKTPDIKPGAVVQAPTTHAVAKMEQAKQPIKYVYVYKDTPTAAAKLGMPAPKPEEKLLVAADIPRTKYGGVAATFINTSSGKAHTQFKANESPWFAFRNDLAIGIGSGIGTRGNTVAGRLRYDVAQIKALTISGEAEGNYAEMRKDPVEGRVMLWLEWRR